MSESTATVAVDERRRFFNVTVTLAVMDFKSRYFDNVLGYFWTLAKPLMLFGVLYAAFTQFIKFGGGIDFFPAYLLTAIVLYTFFSDATSKAVACLVEQESLIRKMPLPLIVIPLSIALTAAITLALNLIAVAVFVGISGVSPQVGWLEFPFLVLVLVVFSTAVASLVANLYVVFRDMEAIWEVVLQMLFWATPIIYTIETVPEKLQRVFLMNPLAVITTEMRHTVIDSSAPSAADVMGGAAWLLIPAAIVVGTLALSLYLHRRIAPQIAERL